MIRVVLQPFPAWREMQKNPSTLSTRVNVSISYNENRNTKRASQASDKMTPKIL